MVGATKMEAVGLGRSGQLLAKQAFRCYFLGRIRDGSVLTHSNPLSLYPFSMYSWDWWDLSVVCRCEQSKASWPTQTLNP